MSTDLIVVEPHQVLEITDFKTIRKNQDLAAIAEHFSLSYQEAVELVRFRIYLAIRAGQLYAALPEERGAERGEDGQYHSSSGLTNGTTKQQAESILGKSRQTISQWVKMAEIKDPYNKADEYCDRCKSVILEPTLKGYYHWLFGIIASHHTGNQENYTPADVLKDVRAVLGQIDLDPASCGFAQKRVKAKKYFTKQDDGLQIPPFQASRSSKKSGSFSRKATA